MWKVLIVGDDRTRIRALQDGLQKQGYGVVTTRDSNAAARLSPDADLVIFASKPDVLSDTEMGALIRQVNCRTPVMLLSEYDTNGRRSSADSARQGAASTSNGILDVLAQVGQILQTETRGNGRLERYRFGEIEIDFQHYRARRSGELIDLSPREFEILRHLIDRRGNVVTREQLLEAVWGSSGSSLTRTVDVHIAKLRRKIGDPPNRPRYIATVHRAGYKFIA